MGVVRSLEGRKNLLVSLGQCEESKSHLWATFPPASIFPSAQQSLCNEQQGGKKNEENEKQGRGREKEREGGPKKRLTWEPHHFDLPAQLYEPLLQELDLCRLAAAVEPLQDDQGPAGDGTRLGVLGFRGRRRQR